MTTGIWHSDKSDLLNQKQTITLKVSILTHYVEINPYPANVENNVSS